jgi:hypothetical protein
MGMEPFISASQCNIAQTTCGGHRLSTWRVNIVDSVEHKRTSVTNCGMDAIEGGKIGNNIKKSVIDDMIIKEEEVYLKRRTLGQRNFVDYDSITIILALD